MVAQPPATTRRTQGSARPDLRIMTFRLGRDQFGIDVEEMHGIFHSVPLVPIMDVESPFVGYLQSAHGRIPVADLRRHVGLPSQEAGALIPWVIAVEHVRGPVGFIVDRVGEVIHLQPSAMEPPQSETARGISLQLSGAVRANGQSIPIPNLSRLALEATQ